MKYYLIYRAVGRLSEKLSGKHFIYKLSVKVALNIKFIVRDKILGISHGRVERAFEC